LNIRFFYLLVFIFFGINNQLYASHDWYGKIFVDYQSISNDINGNKTDVKNNASRFGIKGNFLLNDSNLKLVYQAEYQFDPVDGKARGDDGTLKQRNTFVGIQTDFGMLFAGTHDSAFKKSQLKIDLFNDLAPDIKNILHGENRLEDFIGYTTPKYMGKISATFNSIKNPSPLDKKYRSYSVNFSGNLFQAAIGVDDSMKGYDASRLAILIPLDKSKLGLLNQKTKNLASGMTKNGHVISFSRRIGPKGTFKIQRASSSMKIDSGKHTTIGYDYQLRKLSKIFTFYSQLESSNKRKAKDIFSIGIEHKF
jgi:hypothetical protein